MDAADTLPKILRNYYQKYGDTKVAQRKKKLGRWKSFTWKEYYENVPKQFKPCNWSEKKAIA